MIVAGLMLVSKTSEFTHEGVSDWEQPSAFFDFFHSPI
jgi:hypothetical protein